MSQSVVPPTGEEQQRAQERAAKDVQKAQRDAEQARLDAQQAEQPKQLDALHTEHGDTTIEDNVVAKIAGIAAREVPGVYAMGNAARRLVGNLAQRVSGSNQANVTGGVSVEKGESQAAVDVSVVVDYGVSIVEVADQIRENVIQAVEHGTGLEVVSVDVNVSDVHLPEDDDATAAQPSHSLS